MNKDMILGALLFFQITQPIKCFYTIEQWQKDQKIKDDDLIKINIESNLNEWLTAFDALNYSTNDYEFLDDFFIIDWENHNLKSSNKLSDLIDFDLIAQDMAENNTYSHYLPELN